MSEERLSEIEKTIAQHSYIIQRFESLIEKLDGKFDELARKIEVFSGLVGSQVTLQQNINALDARQTKVEEQLIRIEEQKNNLESAVKQHIDFSEKALKAHAEQSTAKHEKAELWMDRAKYVVGFGGGVMIVLQIWSMIK